VAVQGESAAIASDRISAPGSLLAVQFHGAGSRWQVQLDTGEIWSAWVPESRTMNELAPGTRVRLTWPRTAAVPLATNG
jgi:hypothetical protein